jgi:hypothetical protein
VKDYFENIALISINIIDLGRSGIRLARTGDPA